MKLKITLILQVLAVSIVLGQTAGEKLKKYESSYPIEKIYIAHDRPYYAPGDTIWCQLHLVEGRTHRAFDASPVAYVEWYNPTEKLVRSITLKIEEGSAAFEIPTYAEDSIGTYQIRAFTQYQRNFPEAYFFQKPILLSNEIPDNQRNKEVVKDFDVQFFPEGGYLVNGLKGQVAFKAIDQDGQAINVTGVIRPKGGDPLQSVKAIHEGIGVFSFVPQAGVAYELLAKHDAQEKTFVLPRPLSSGYTLSVNNRGANFFDITILPSNGLSLEGLQLLGHIRGQVILDQKLSAAPQYKVRIPREQVPSGLLHLTVFDQNNRPLAERLFFNKNPQQNIQLEAINVKDRYSFKEEVEIGLNALTTQEISDAHFSVGVYNGSLVNPQKNSTNILNYLWLQSDLEGDLPDINQYFLEDNAKSRVLLDYVMLTHAWRRFKWQEVFQSDGPPIAYPPQENIAIAGKVSTANGKKPVKADVFLNILSATAFSSVNITTEEDGLFYFKGFDFKDTTDLVFQANIFNEKKKGKLKKGESKRTGNKNVDIEIINLQEVPYSPKAGPYLQFTEKAKETYAEAVEDFKTVKKAYSGIITADLEEVTIEASRLALKQEREKQLRQVYRDRGVVYSPSAKNLYLDDLPNKGLNYPDVFELIQSRIPGVLVDRSEPFNKKVFLSNANTRITQDVQAAILVIDGLIIDQNNGSTPPPIQPIEVQSIDVVSPIQASVIYGEYAIGGAIVIMTRENRAVIGDQSEADPKGTLAITHPGYYAARDFYVPKFEANKVDRKPDLRTIIFWSPKMSLKNGKANLNFRTGDKAGTFVIQIEGITEDGIPFVHWSEIQVEE